MTSLPADRTRTLETQLAELRELAAQHTPPEIQVDAQIVLTLRTLGGLSTAEIARVFLVPEPTMGQRLVRAKGYTHWPAADACRCDSGTGRTVDFIVCEVLQLKNGQIVR